MVLIYLFRPFEKCDLFKKVNDVVSIIDTEALGKANSVAAYLVTGTEVALIDMGYQSSANIVIKSLTDHGVSSDGLDYLLPTHVHLDHSGSCGELAKKFTNASILVHPKGEAHLIDPTRLWEGAKQLFGNDLMERYGRPEPIERTRLRVAGDSDVVDLGRGVILRIVWTPGHASHHLSYEWEGHRAFFTGDAVGLFYPDFPILIPTTPPTSFHLEKALESLKLLAIGSPSEFYTPHFGVLKNANQWIEDNVRSLLLWQRTIEDMTRSGIRDEQITQSIIKQTCERLGRSINQVPDYLLISIKISVLGFMRYLEAKP